MKTMRILPVAILLSGLMAAGTAHALRNYWLDVVFYADPNMQTPVGGRSVPCSGSGYSWGIKTEYSIQYSGAC